MIYTFSCPAPCRRVIRVDARNDEDAVGKIIKAGAMTCRNKASHDTCDTTRPVLSLVDGHSAEGSCAIDHAGGRVPRYGIEGSERG